MRLVGRQHIREISGALLSLFVVTLSATCLAQADMSAAETACCAEMASDCGAAMARVHQCCRTPSSQDDPQLAPGQRHAVQAPAQFAGAVLGIPPLRTDLAAGVTSSRASDLSPPRTAPPAYLLLSVFRV
jgi:hypothetical protein